MRSRRMRASRRRTNKKKGGSFINKTRSYNSLNIRYGDIKVVGQPLSLGATRQEPSVRIPPGHFLIMYDPDALGTYVHWIKGSSTILPYQPPTPPPGSGVHRYIFKLVKGSPRAIPVKRSPVDIDSIIEKQPYLHTVFTSSSDDP